MRTVLRTNYENFADTMIDFAEDGDDVCCVTYEQNTYNLLRELLNYDEVTPCGIEVHNEEISGYNKEYYITLTKDFYLFVEPAYYESNEYHKEGYYEVISNTIFVDEDVCGEIIPHLYSDDEILKVEFVDTDNFKIDFDWNRNMDCGECSMDCENCALCGDDDFDDSESKMETVSELLYGIKNLLDEFFD